MGLWPDQLGFGHLRLKRLKLGVVEARIGALFEFLPRISKQTLGHWSAFCFESVAIGVCERGT